MAKQEQTNDDSESGEETRENSSSEELEEENNKNGSNSKEEISEYEKQRLRRMKENSAIMEAMGLRNMASNLMMASVPTKQSKNLMMGKKGKEKAVEEDEEYIPGDGDEEFSSVSEEEEEEEQDDDDDEDFVGRKGSGRRSRKVKNNKQLKSKKKVHLQKLSSTSDFIDEDAELMQAIALSLKESGVSGNVDCGTSQGGGAKMIDSPLNGRKENAHIQEDTGKRKRKKPVTSRVQMTKDEVVMHFFQFDEAGKGGIHLRDLQRVVNTHDFTWTDSEMDDMIRCFDSDGDGKLSLDDFRAIVSRCNMIKESENALPVANS